MTISTGLDWTAAICGAVLAIAAAIRARRSIARWSFVVGMLAMGTECALTGLSRNAADGDAIVRLQTWRLIISSVLPGTWLLFSLCYARAKDQPLIRRNRYGLVAAILLPPAAAWFLRGDLINRIHHTVLSQEWILRLGLSGTLLSLFSLVCSVWVVVNLERTYRASVGTMRWRIKFMLLGVGLLFVARVYTSSQALLFRGIDSTFDTLNSGALVVAALLILRSLLRAGHFDLEVYPSQSVLQNSLTVLLAGAYLLIVGVFAKVVTYFGGDSAFAAKAFLILVSLVLLTVFLQSERARLQLRQFVSRHFRRSPYDYRAVWRTFTEGTASRVEQTDLCRVLVRLTADTFNALSVAVWLLDEKKECLVPAASTLHAIGSAGESPRVDTAALSKRFEKHREPLDIENSEEEWVVALKRFHPRQFEHGGNRVCVPLIGRGGLLGLLVIGDRVSGLRFSVEDFDMLKCVGDHAAASLLNVQLSTKLGEAKELQAFQAMAAFFVHDLKNAASTLNLMLQNLPVHYDDPAFREDALRGISKTVSHINRLIGRLGSLRHELKIETAEADFNELVTSVLTGLEHAPGRGVIKEIAPLPTVLLDRDQMHKVITNLVLNATEAVGADGQVRIATAQENGWAVLTVADNGCGMSPDFLAHSLFRPFHTTKKTGLGIGMFQSKMIVEAHGGKIAVTSEAGKGTTFRVFLRTHASR